MRSLLVLRQRRMLRGWVKWIPVMAIPFTVLFTHAWFNIEILRADYVLRDLDKERRSLSDKLDHAGVKQSLQQDPETLAAVAVRLGFGPLKPGQREVIPYDPAAFSPAPESGVFALAKRGPARTTPMAPSDPVSTAPVTAPDVASGLNTDRVPSVVETAAPTDVQEPGSEAVPTVWVALDAHADDAFQVPVAVVAQTPVVLDLPADDDMEMDSIVDMDLDDLDVL